MEIFQIVILSLSGLMLSFVGALRMIKPMKSYCLKTYDENSNIKLEGKTDILNEMRGSGSLTLVAGIVILLGIIFPELRLTSFVVAIIIFLGFAVGRVISHIQDGKPNSNLIQGLSFEIILGGLNSAVLINSLM